MLRNEISGHIDWPDNKDFYSIQSRVHILGEMQAAAMELFQKGTFPINIFWEVSE